MNFSKPLLVDEKQLVALARKQNTRAFEVLYRLNVKAVYSLAFRLTANTALAEEMTQEVFIRAWQKLSLFKGKSAFSTWLYRLATNVILGLLRKKQPIVVSLNENLPELQQGDKSSSPGQQMDLEKALLKLPHGARQIFVLYEIEGHQHNEIASLLGIAEGTSKTQLHRARKLLQEQLI